MERCDINLVLLAKGEGQSYKITDFGIFPKGYKL